MTTWFDPRAPLRALSAALLAVAACSSSAGPAGPPEAAAGARGAAQPAARRLERDTPVRMAGGATFTAPAGWWLSERADAAHIQDPDRELGVWLLAARADTRAAAVADAWRRIAPGFALAVARDQEIPAREGWDAIGQTMYVTRSEESRIVLAVARRRGATWQISLVDGTQAALQRRAAQLQAAIESVKVPGLAAESLVGRPVVLDGERLAALDRFVDQARRQAGIPGAAIAVVRGGDVVLSRGYGVRQQGRAGAVTPDTRFLIGSTTKALTTLLMARLVDRRALTWDAPMTRLLPGFALGDAEVTRRLALRHTVCACTGMPRQDDEFVFEYAGWDAERRLAAMASMKPTTGFGETFQYSNLMVAAGGFAAGHTHAPDRRLGPAYRAAMRDLVFAPLGMSRSTVDFASGSRGDAARPHARGLTSDARAVPLDLERMVISVAPAGAAWSTADDLARYVALELAGGRGADGEVLVSEASLLARREPQVKITGDKSYGLGLFVSREDGIPVVGHAGNTFGFTSDLAFLPEHDLGLVVLANAGRADAFAAAVRRRLLELALGAEPRAETDLARALDLAEAARVDRRGLVRAAPDRAWLDSLVGRYVHPGLGEVRLERRGGHVLVDAGEWSSEVAEETDRDGTRKLLLVSPGLAGLELVPGRRGGAPVLVLAGGQARYELVRR